MKVDSLKKTTAFILVCICMIPFLSGCWMTYSLWDHSLYTDKRTDQKITVSGNRVYFQATDIVKYPFPPFHWTVKQNHNRIFTTKTGNISEWIIQTDRKAPRFSRNTVLPVYFLPEKNILLSPEDQISEKRLWVGNTHLKVYPDDIHFLQKPFLFCGFNIRGKRVSVLQLPVKFQAGKLQCCQPEDSGMICKVEISGSMLNLSRTWVYFWTPLTIICDIIFSPVYLVLHACK